MADEPTNMDQAVQEQQEPQIIESKGELLGLIELKTDVVPIKALGGRMVKIRELTSDQRVEFGMDNVDAQGKPMMEAKRAKNTIAKIVQWGVIDSRGSPLFQPADLGNLRSRSGGAVDEMATAILRLSGLTQESADKASKN